MVNKNMNAIFLIITLLLINITEVEADETYVSVNDNFNIPNHEESITKAIDVDYYRGDTFDLGLVQDSVDKVCYMDCIYNNPEYQSNVVPSDYFHNQCASYCKDNPYEEYEGATARTTSSSCYNLCSLLTLEVEERNCNAACSRFDFTVNTPTVRDFTYNISLDTLEECNSSCSNLPDGSKAIDKTNCLTACSNAEFLVIEYNYSNPPITSNGEVIPPPSIPDVGFCVQGCVGDSDEVACMERCSDEEATEESVAFYSCTGNCSDGDDVCKDACFSAYTQAFEKERLICFVNPKTRDILNGLFGWFKIIAPLLVVVYSTLDFAKVAISLDTEGDMKKAKTNFMKRMVAALILFILPSLIDLILGSGASCGIT